MTRLERFASYAWYPAGMAAALLLFERMRALPLPAVATVYGPVALVGAAVALLQLRFPERTQWRPRWQDVKTDLVFISVVQLALPRALGVAASLALARVVHAHAPLAAWPHAWPVLAQVALMVLVVDFARYWLHRACHHYPWLWRLHAVHHAPRLIYSLNAARFHPVEKLLHFCVDTAPFLALGVGHDVLAGYFVVYAANGLFQHSNVRLRYGWLNYFVGSAETHRWHHASDRRAAACNFGSTTLVWDLVFGTWRLWRSRVKTLGIAGTRYPEDVGEQLLAPFRAETSGPSRAWRTRIADVLVRARLAAASALARWRVRALVRAPMQAQRAVLRRILRANRDTDYGRRHGFTAIDDHASFARRVPIADFEALRPFAERAIADGSPTLTREPPTRYVRTSGSTAAPKDIPLTRSHLRALRRIHAMSVGLQYDSCPEAFRGRILAIVSAADEGTLANGAPYGSASGIVAGNTPALVREKFVLPPAVATIADSRVRYRLILRLALAARDITYMGSANPTTLLALARLYREHAAALTDDVRDGTFHLAHETPHDVLAAVADRLQAQPERAAELARLHAHGGRVTLGDLWPDARLVVTWTCGSAGIAADALRSELAPRTRILELGYIASEFRGTVTLGRRAGSGFLTLDTHFFEFIERDRWDRGERDVVTLDGLRKGLDYYVIVTTPSGLYRYFINDIVRVTGFLRGTPLVRFVQKGKGVTSLTGEKLYEGQVLKAVRDALAAAGRAAAFFVMLADEAAGDYALYVEAGPPDGAATPALAAEVDRRLAALNVEYAAKRESGRLPAPRMHWLAEGTGERHKAFSVAQGQREGQFKATALAYRRAFGFAIDACVASAP